ncbi:Rad2 nuclease, partial [Cladochytrium tenue]
MKRPTERGRRRRRAELRERARAAQASGDAARAAELLQQSVDVTPRMAHELIARLRALQVEFVVAPYEADAQLAALERAGRVDAVLTEDSDL